LECLSASTLPDADPTGVAEVERSLPSHSGELSVQVGKSGQLRRKNLPAAKIRKLSTSRPEDAQIADRKGPAARLIRS
jgi:hypothetical protein